MGGAGEEGTCGRGSCAEAGLAHSWGHRAWNLTFSYESGLYRYLSMNVKFRTENMKFYS